MINGIPIATASVPGRDGSEPVVAATRLASSSHDVNDLCLRSAPQPLLCSIAIAGGPSTTDNPQTLCQPKKNPYLPQCRQTPLATSPLSCNTAFQNAHPEDAGRYSGSLIDASLRHRFLAQSRLSPRPEPDHQT